MDRFASSRRRLKLKF